MAQPTNEPSSSSPPPETPIVDESAADTEPTTPAPDPTPIPTTSPWFTFDDIPKSMFFLYVLGNIFFLEVPERFFGG